MIKIIEIQKKIAEAIKQSELNQSEISRRLGIKPQQISCYKKGQKLPALDTFANLCKVLDLDPNDILCINDNELLKTSNPFLDYEETMFKADKSKINYNYKKSK